MQIELLKEKIEDRLKAAVLEIAIPKLIAEYVQVQVFKYLKETERDSIQDEFILMNIWYESRYKGRIQKRFKEMYAEVLTNMKKKGFKVAHARYKEDFDASKWLFNRKAWYGTLTADGKSLTAAPLERGGNFELGKLGVSTTFDMEDPRVIAWIATNAKNAAFSITNTQYKKLQRIMMDAIADGEGIPVIRERIIEQLGLELARAEKIARTEILKASNRGIMLAMEQSGVVEGREWIATFDSSTCPICAEMDGRTMPLGEPYYEKSSDPVTFTGTEQTPAPEGGLSVVFDYESIQHPPIHVDCRCTLLAILRKV